MVSAAAGGSFIILIVKRKTSRRFVLLPTCEVDPGEDEDEINVGTVEAPTDETRHPQQDQQPSQQLQL